MRSFNYWQWRVIGILVLGPLTLLPSPSVLADPPPPGQDCAGTPLGTEDYAAFVEVLQELNDMYTRLFDTPFQWCEEGALLLESEAFEGIEAPGQRQAAGQIEAFTFELLQSVPVAPEDVQPYLTAEEGAAYVEHGVSISLVWGWLRTCRGLALISAQIIYADGAAGGRGGILTFVRVVPEENWCAMVRSYCLDANPAPEDCSPQACAATGGGSESDCQAQKRTCYGDAARYYSLARNAANAILVACTIAAVAAVTKTALWCAGLCGWTIGIGWAACLLLVAAQLTLALWACTAVYEYAMAAAQRTLNNDIAACDARFSCEVALPLFEEPWF